MPSRHPKQSAQPSLVLASLRWSAHLPSSSRKSPSGYRSFSPPSRNQLPARSRSPPNARRLPRSPPRESIVLPQKRREEGMYGNDRDVYTDGRHDRDHGSDFSNDTKRRRIEIAEDDPRDARQLARPGDPNARDWDNLARGRPSKAEVSADEISSRWCSTDSAPSFI